MFKKIALLTIAVFSAGSLAEENQEEYQDMSDPLAVYTQAGIGYTDKGLNLKVGQTYDTGSDTTMAMNVVELKGIAGETLGLRDNNEPMYSAVDNSIDSFRFRNFKVDLTNGRGTQIDVNYNVDKETADASYSMLQALPKWGALQLYPLAGVGVTLANDAERGYEIPGTFGVVGMYSKVELTEKVWLNYNPMWLTTLSGSDEYKNQYYAGESNIFTHEFALSYQINPRANVRYFANWNDKVSFGDGDHRIEFNYQF